MTDSTPPPPAVSSWMRLRILGFLCVAAAIAYVHRAAISVPAGEIANDLRFSNLATGMGNVQSAFYLGYALMQLPSGWLADRLGSRRAMALYCGCWSLFTLLTAFAYSERSLLILWGLMGVMQAGAFPSAAKAIGELFPDASRARASGLLACGMGIGGALAPALTGFVLWLMLPLAEEWSVFRWRLLLIVYAIPGFLWTAVFLFAVPARQLPVAPKRTTRAVRINWLRALRSVPLILLCAQQFFRAAAMVFFLTWFPTFLQQTRGVTLETSGLLTSMAGIGGVLGSLLGGFASDWLLIRTGNARLSRQGIAVAGMSLCSLLMIASFFVADVRGSVALIAVGAFCATFGGVSGYTVAIAFGGRHVATVFATMNMCGNLGASAFPAAAGWLVANTGNWNLLLFFFAGIMAVDAVCWAVLNPKGTLMGDEDDGTH
ncbi:MAG: MFS transporter [Planctomycetaceae bacterium]|nr:MFS transporter [Planctomycetaceae bacterium]